MPTKTKLTSHLVSLSTPTPYSAATEHDFLTAASNGTLSMARLSLYLSQDRIYAAHAYPRFLGLLLASIPFSSLHGIRSPEEQFNRRILEVVDFSVQNIVREASFFVDIADKYGLILDGWKERKATRDYTAELFRVGATGNVQDSLVFLWAMERVYLDAWKYVAAGIKKSSAPASPALEALVNNWTNSGFEKFVIGVEDLVNELGIEPGSAACIRAEQIWARVLELEAAFWPNEDELALLAN